LSSQLTSINRLTVKSRESLEKAKAILATESTEGLGKPTINLHFPYPGSFREISHRLGHPDVKYYMKATDMQQLLEDLIQDIRAIEKDLIVQPPIMGFNLSGGYPFFVERLTGNKHRLYDSRHTFQLQMFHVVPVPVNGRVIQDPIIVRDLTHPDSHSCTIDELPDARCFDLDSEYCLYNPIQCNGFGCARFILTGEGSVTECNTKSTYKERPVIVDVSCDNSNGFSLVTYEPTSYDFVCPGKTITRLIGPGVQEVPPACKILADGKPIFQQTINNVPFPLEDFLTDTPPTETPSTIQGSWDQILLLVVTSGVGLIILGLLVYCVFSCQRCRISLKLPDMSRLRQSDRPNNRTDTESVEWIPIRRKKVRTFRHSAGDLDLISAPPMELQPLDKTTNAQIAALDNPSTSGSSRPKALNLTTLYSR
jgi:hypothetical protein